MHFLGQQSITEQKPIPQLPGSLHDQVSISQHKQAKTQQVSSVADVRLTSVLMEVYSIGVLFMATRKVLDEDGRLDVVSQGINGLIFLIL